MEGIATVWVDDVAATAPVRVSQGKEETCGPTTHQVRCGGLVRCQSCESVSGESRVCGELNPDNETRS